MRPSRLLSLLACIMGLLFAPCIVLGQQARMHGTVLDETGQPLAKARVLLDPVEAGGARVSTTTSRQGSYLISPLRAGSYHLSVESAGKSMQSVQAKALTPSRDVAWEMDEESKPGEPPTLRIDNGFEVDCNVLMGPAVPAEDALTVLTRQAQQGDCRGALPELEKFVASTPNVAKAHYLAGFCQASVGKPEAAAQSLARTLELQPKFPGAALLEGQVLSSLGKSAGAETLYKQEISNAGSGPLAVDAWVALGILYRDSGRDADAVDAFQHVLGLQPKRAEPYAELASLLMKLGQDEKAEAILTQARESGVEAAPLLLNMGIAYFNKKNYPRAASAFERLIEAGGKNAELGIAHASLGRCRLREGKKAEAIASFKKSLELDPKGSMAEETRKLLQDLEKK